MFRPVQLKIYIINVYTFCIQLLIKGCCTMTLMLLRHIAKNGCNKEGSRSRLCLEQKRAISLSCRRKEDSVGGNVYNNEWWWYHYHSSQTHPGANSRMKFLMSFMALSCSYWNISHTKTNHCFNEADEKSETNNNHDIHINNNNKNNDSHGKAVIETDLLDKLAAKPYLHYHNSAETEDVMVTNASRPKGIPKRVRVLVVDVPEFRDVFSDGECRVNLSRVFADNIAPVKNIYMDDTNNDEKKNTKKNKKKLEIPQKTLATALVRCRKNNRIGVELLETSMMNLNPHNLRRIYNFGGYQYDPGKYAADPRIKTKTNSESGPADADNEEEMNKKSNETDKQTKSLPKPKKIVTKPTTSNHVNFHDEIEAPWNQYAWIEEIYIRIHGLIPFGAPVESAPFLSRMVLGHAYKRTVPSSRGYISYFVPSFFLPSSYTNADGIDGDYQYSSKKEEHQNSNIVWNRASCKPHAVIVNGAAMQCVPGSLRYLTKCCREAYVPLFVVNDPRVWGATTHDSLSDAASSMRTIIKRNILQNALSIKEGNMFHRGRQVGRFETDAKWKAQDISRKTRQAVYDAHDRYKRSQEDDWSKLNSEQLLKRLIEHKVITSVVIPNQSNSEQPSPSEEHIYTEALLEACQLILQKQEKTQTQKQNTFDTSESSIAEDDATTLD